MVNGGTRATYRNQLDPCVPRVAVVDNLARGS